MTYRHALFVSLMIGVSLGLGVGNAKPTSKGSLDFVLPADAQDVVKDRVGASDQILFKVKRRYPTFAFSDETIARLAKDGWKKCSSPSDDWSSFVDMASGSSLRIHQKVLHLKKSDRVLVLIGRYTSPGPTRAGRQVESPPASDEQIANVIGIKGTSAELDEALRMFNARC